MMEANQFLDECEVLDDLVAERDPEAWRVPTPAVPWTIAHQIAHLAWTDELSLQSVQRPDEFAHTVMLARKDPARFVDEAAEEGARLDPGALLGRWRAGRAALADALRTTDPGVRLAWFGPSMSARSMASARLMETWAHGQDVADALGTVRTPTDRLRVICHLGVRTRDFAFAINRQAVPPADFRIELRSPSGEAWEWGPEDATERVSGSAEEFCLVVTQRREAADTSLRATVEAAHWLTFAQVFAGPPKGSR